MSSWAARAKVHFSQDRQKPTAKTAETPLLAVLAVPIWDKPEKSHSDFVAANDPAPDPDRWCWPHSDAMTGREIDTFTARLARFTDKGVIHGDGERLADKLVIRDRESDGRRLCLECQHLGGYSRQSWRCGNWQRAGVAIRQRDNQLPADLAMQLQRCNGFSKSNQS